MTCNPLLLPEAIESIGIFIVSPVAVCALFAWMWYCVSKD